MFFFFPPLIIWGKNKPPQNLLAFVKEFLIHFTKFFLIIMKCDGVQKKEAVRTPLEGSGFTSIQATPVVESYV